MQKFLILGASFTNKDTLVNMLACKDISFIVFDGNKNSFAKELDCAFECVDISNPAAVLESAKCYDINGVYPMNDHAVISAAYLSMKLGVKGVSLATAYACVDKGYMRTLWDIAAVKQPEFKVVKNKDEIFEFATFVGYPIVIKPVNCGGGGRGVYVIHDRKDLDVVFGEVKKFLYKSDSIIAEKYIEGVETSVEVIKRGNDLDLVAYSDKIKEDSLCRVATNISYPGKFSEEVVHKIKEYSAKALDALGVDDGIAHIEYIVTGSEDVYILELGLRVGGGHTFSPIASHVSGIDYPRYVVDFYLGNVYAPDIKPYRGACYYFFVSQKKGRFINIDGLDAVSDNKNIHSVNLWKKSGDIISGLENSMDRIGCVVCLADTREDADSVMEKVQKQVVLNIAESE